MTKEVILTQGKVALVDDEDFKMLVAISANWCVSDGYAFNRKLGRMHRFLLGAPDGVMVDHRNGDRLDNRRDNLRLCTNSLNQANRQVVRGASPFKGVTWQRRPDGRGFWNAKLIVNGAASYLGRHNTDLEAAAAYNAAAAKAFGEFAHLNDLTLPVSPLTSHEPIARRQTSKASPSGFKGVTFDAVRGKWMAQLTRDGVTHLKKRFPTAEAAAQAYDEVALKVYGSEAKTNRGEGVQGCS
jgi:hypothetical protein